MIKERGWSPLLLDVAPCAIERFASGMRIGVARHARLAQAEVGDVPAIFRRMALFAGQLRVGSGQSEDHVRVVERCEILPLPGYLVDEHKIGSVVLGMAFGAFGFMGFRQIVMVAPVQVQLFLDFRMAIQASGV